MGPSFNEQFDQHGAWRRAFAQQLKRLGQWMGSHDLMDAAVEERLQRLEEQVRSDKVTVAFVAEFSRGKSELINAIFFAGYGRRIMPASAGRTTMCPTELGYENGTAPSLRLLPIDTRMQSLGLAEWRLKADRWVKVPLDMDDPAQLAQALEKVSEVRRVSVDEARALGFWSDEAADENPVLDAAGMVEVPMWRHAVINIPHPLLKQGLVILDTPGLNAVGAEPELTINLIPQAHAVVFILGADTGVTRSDLTIWRDHLGTAEDATDARLVVLNKIDTLWDTLSSPSQVQAQLERQRQTSAELLGVPLSHVVPVSAQKGLVAKINCDDILLESSGLPLLEEALAEGIMGRRQAILRATVASGVASLQSETRRVINIRRRDLDDQMLELRSLRGKNASVIDAMRGRIEQEQQEFEASTAKIQAVR
ncbi:dynamin family protein, partial [Diaphorobacter sp.]